MTRDDAVELLRGLVAIPSLSGEEANASTWLVAQMREAGFCRAEVDAAGNAVGEIGADDAPRTLVLLGHIDTVPGRIPVRIEATPEGDALYGRGSVDAKGPLATFVAAASRLGDAFARASGVRVVVVGAVEEEAATSKGARFIASRFDGVSDPIPQGCVIGEPSRWHRITLGYKGRLLMHVSARQPMAHTAGPDASVAAIVVDVWNWICGHAAGVNEGREKVFDQLTPSLRRFNTATGDDMFETVEAEIAWRLPLGVEAAAMVEALVAWAASHVGAASPALAAAEVVDGGQVILDGARTSLTLRFRGAERPWRGDRQNALVRSFLHSIRETDATATPGFLVKTGTSDMNVVAPVWKCPVVAYGPGDSALDHTPHEHLPLDEYWRAIQVLEGALRTWSAPGRT